MEKKPIQWRERERERRSDGEERKLANYCISTTCTYY